MFGGLDSIVAAGWVESPDPDDAEEFSLSKRQAARRFGPPEQKDQIRELIGQHIPENTKKVTSWYMNVCKAWSERMLL